MAAITHVLDESANPPSAMVWRMLCGESCFAYEDGTLDPDLDFYGLREAAKATCPGCRVRALREDLEKSRVRKEPTEP
jgi:hypothetical protein